ncbi:MAG: ATP-dependent DNA helicase [Gammaproteobacteria bacterium]|nr:ATP-dependent DNA helicase [Gammaproteobacteria bacterium]
MSESAEVLARDGLFHRQITDFTPRRAQQEMARSVENALEHHGRLVVESGTGTGKTFAYLVPVLLSGKRTIISTGTKHLQEQIFYRDLPVVMKTLGCQVNAVLLKGRANYLCKYRLALANRQTDLVGRQNPFEYDRINGWSVRTKTGDISEVEGVGEDHAIWKQVTSTVDNCLGPRCRDYADCFVMKARQKAREAEVVVVNHHLYFSSLGLSMKSGGLGEILPDHSAVVFDEAHSLAETASQFFGLSVSSHDLKELFQDILAAENEENSAVHFAENIARLESILEDLFSHFGKQAVSPADLSELENTGFDVLFAGLGRELGQLQDLLEAASPVGEGLARCRDRSLNIAARIESWRENRDSRSVSWMEWEGRWFRLHLTPVNLGPHFHEIMSGPPISWIFTSATLAVGDDFSSFCNEVGLQYADMKRWDSPYDFDSNTLLYLPPGMPDPRNASFQAALEKTILEVTNASRGRAFCLFTSHAMLQNIHRRIRKKIAWPLLVQGHAPRQKLLQQFMQSDNQVLLGTSSFWEGVDVKGDALSCVIIDKLPFASPAHPVLRRKLQVCEEQGGNPFMDLQVPNAVIALKQGVGRLIRSEKDRGILVICDPRITEKSYGHRFRSSLPSIPVTHSFFDVRQFFQ